MKIAIGSDARTHVTDAVITEVQKRGYEVVLFGPLAEHDPEQDWPLTSSKVAELVAQQQVDEGIVFCWTGTGASIAARSTPPPPSPADGAPAQNWPQQPWTQVGNTPAPYPASAPTQFSGPHMCRRHHPDRPHRRSPAAGTAS